MKLTRYFGLRGVPIMVLGVCSGFLMHTLAAGAEPETGGSNGFQLRINDVAGLEEPWPLVGGLPFPEGELHDASRIRVVDAEGREVPTQIDVVATWSDGSIRWAQAGLLADPRGDYRVEYGPDVERGDFARPLQVRREGDGSLVVETGAATYEFLPGQLLPDSARIGDVAVLTDSGDGAYLVDNRGRLARVAGEWAEVETELLKEGPGRVVVRREGWYVTEDGEQVAKARMWFYFTAGSPFARMTHSIVFTEDTNDLWVRDYGLEFRTPSQPEEVVFALSEAIEAERFPPSAGGVEVDASTPDRAQLFSSGLYERGQTLFPVTLEGNGEVYLLQDEYPHVTQRSFRAVIAEAPGADLLSPDAAEVNLGNLWTHPWLLETEVAGDWGEARYEDHSLMVVMPQLAQRFPKEIAFGPEGVRVAFWSGRSGRELDFRAVTLVNEYWQDWAHRADGARASFGGLGDVERGPHAATALARQPSNAQGAARTHDVWLLPRIGEMDEPRLKARAVAAAHPPLLQADPAWLGASKAVGWPLHPVDMERFPDVEAALSDYWEEVLGGVLYNAGIRRSGFIMWGKNATLARVTRWFRISRGAGHYGLDRSAWQLYMRSGDRRYYDYARHFTRFSGDLNLHHWDVDGRFRGGFASPNVDLPFYWDGDSRLGGSFWTFGWLMDYYLTGDEYAEELLSMVADAYRTQAEPGAALPGYTHGHVYNLSILYDHTGDETIKELARHAAHTLIDLDNPTGLNDALRYGAYYKISTEWLFPLYLYYNATGDPAAREAILRAVDDKFRFNHEDWTQTPHGRGPSSSQTFRLLIFSEAYRWTGNPAYLGVVEHMLLKYPVFSLKGHNFYHGAPAAQYLIANATELIPAFPLLAATRDPDHNLRLDFEFIEAEALPPINVHKAAGEPVTLSVYVRMPNDVAEETEPAVRVRRVVSEGDGVEVDEVQIQKQQAFKTKNAGRRDLRRWHFHLTLPEEAESGVYSIHFPDAATVVVLESDAEVMGFSGD